MYNKETTEDEEGRLIPSLCDEVASPSNTRLQTCSWIIFGNKTREAKFHVLYDSNHNSYENQSQPNTYTE